MTENEKTLARALTPAQRSYLLTSVVRYRRQIAADIVKLAEAELQADALAEGGAPC